ncbi:MAG: energy transducer TonB [Vicinamibacterales bacterium]
MPRDLFAAESSSAVTPSRRSSLIVASAVLHAALILVILLVAILVPEVLPRPHAAGLDWDPTVGIVSLADVPLPPPPPRAATPQVAPPAPDAVPLEAPSGVSAEAPPAPAPTPAPGVVNGRDFGTELAVAATPPPPPVQPPTPREPVRVFAGVSAPMKLQDAAPAYPVMARTTGVQGLVIIEATIDGSGNVVATKVLRSVPLLDAAAVDAVRQWKYAPARLNGEPIPVLITVTVNFVLGAR